MPISRGKTPSIKASKQSLTPTNNPMPVTMNKTPLLGAHHQGMKVILNKLYEADLSSFRFFSSFRETLPSSRKLSLAPKCIQVKIPQTLDICVDW